MFNFLKTRNSKLTVLEERKIDQYINDIQQKIAKSNNPMQVLVVLIQENQNTTMQIVNKLHHNGYKVIVKKYYNEGYELGVVL